LRGFKDPLTDCDIHPEPACCAANGEYERAAKLLADVVPEMSDCGRWAAARKAYLVAPDADKRRCVCHSGASTPNNSESVARSPADRDAARTATVVAAD